MPGACGLVVSVRVPAESEITPDHGVKTMKFWGKGFSALFLVLCKL